MRIRLPLASLSRKLFGFVTAAGVLALGAAPGCVTPGEDAEQAGSGIGGMGGVYLGVGGTMGLGGNGGAGNEELLTGDGGIGGTAGTGVKMACSQPPQNYPFTPGYQISDEAVTNAQNAVASMSRTNRANQLRGTPHGNYNNWSDIFRSVDVPGVKGFKFRDGPRGVNLMPEGDKHYSTTFPAPVLRGAAFDIQLEHQIGQAMGDEMVAAGHTMLLAPTTNILRHPFWGRAQETYGEDSFLLGRLGTAVVVGVQEYVPACAKHYAANNIENGRLNLNAMMDEQTLLEVYARHYQMMIEDGGVSCVMAAYNAINGTRSTENSHLLNDILRQQFGFQGLTLSDWWSMAGGATNRNTDVQKATCTRGIKGGLDIEMPWALNYGQLEAQVMSNAITDAEISAAATRVVREKFRFNVANGSGLKSATTRLAGASITDNDDHLWLARRAAVEGMVLLKNDDKTLPIKQEGRTVSSIAVIGKRVNWHTMKDITASGTVDFVRDIRIGDIGSSRVAPDPGKTVGPLAAITEMAGPDVMVKGGNDATPANDADFIIVIAGLTPQDEGEEYTGAGDRTSFKLDAKTNQGQEALIMQVAQIAQSRGKPMVVVLEAGSLIDMSAWIGMVPAVVMAWYPGQQGGAALGHLLMGTANFSGKLPITWSTTGWPTFNAGTTTQMDYLLGYRRFDQMGVTFNPAMGQYPFGYGLSYTTYRYENVSVPCNDVAKTGNIPVTVDVYNTGEVDGDETIMVFVRYLDPAPSGAQRSVKELKAFQRVSLAKGQGKRVTIDLRASDLKVFDPTSSTLKVITGRVQILVGSSSERTTLLPASDTDTSTIVNILP